MNTKSRSCVEVILQNLDVNLAGCPILRDIDWHLKCDQHWAVLGANGAGKSTLLKLIYGVVWPRQNKGQRTYILANQERLTPIDMRRRVSLVSSEIQDLYWKRSWNIPVRTVVETGFFDTPFLYDSLTPTQKQQCLEMCERLGIAHLITRGMLELSTGETKKVLLARAMVKRPGLLLLDECCIGLDPESRENFLSMVDKLAEEEKVQIVATSHRIEELPRCVTHVATIVAGRIDFTGKKQDLSLTERQTASPHQKRIAFEQKLALPSMAGTGEKELIRISNTSVSIQGTTVLHDISWSMTDTQDWAILGPNGSGKSTFLKLITGAIHPRPGGKVSRFFAPEAENIWDVRSCMGYVSSSLQTGYPPDTNGQDVILSGFFSSLGMHTHPSKEQCDRALSLADALNISSLLKRRADSFSYGQMRKCLLARAMVHKPRVLLLDEPFAGVEQDWRNEVRSFLMQCRSQGTRIILVTHHLENLEELVSHRLVLEKGKIIEQSRYGE